MVKRRFRKRRFRRRFNRRRKVRINRLRSTIHNYKKTASVTPLAPGAAAWSGYTIAFQLDQLDDFTQIAKLYDQYRVMACTVIFYPQFNFVNLQSTNDMPVIYSAIDYDGAIAPNNKKLVLNYTTCKFQFFNRPHRRFVKPMLLARSTGVANDFNFNLSRHTWVDMSQTAARYFGLIGGFDQTVNYTAFNVNVDIVYYFQCRNVR